MIEDQFENEVLTIKYADLEKQKKEDFEENQSKRLFIYDEESFKFFIVVNRQKNEYIQSFVDNFENEKMAKVMKELKEKILDVCQRPGKLKYIFDVIYSSKLCVKQNI